MLVSKGVGYGMEMDLYKSRFLNERPDGVWYKHKISWAGVSSCMRMCLIFLVLNIDIPLHLDSRGKPFFRTSAFFSSLVPVSIISIRISFLNCQIFYFRSLLTLRSVSLTLISPMWQGVTLTLFPKFQYLDEKMYLGRWLFPLATIFCGTSLS